MIFVKRALFMFFTFFCCLFINIPKTYACDPLGCLLGGNKQDILAIVEITYRTENIFDAKILFLFQQTKIKDLELNDTVQISDLDASLGLTDEEFKNVAIGKKYLMSLVQDNNVFVPAWGVYEVTGSAYSDMQLVNNKNSTDTALQIFINSGGEVKDFNFVGDSVYVNDGEDNVVKVKSKNSNFIFYGIIAGIIIISTTSFLIYKKTKK